MTLRLLRSLAEANAFDPTPKYSDVGVYHVRFESMGTGAQVESRLLEGALRGERIALIADSGCGKTSVVSHVFGPTTEQVAPILVPVRSLEEEATKAEQVADSILSQLWRQAEEGGRLAPDAGSRLGRHRHVTNVNRRSWSFATPRWLANANLASQIEQQITTTESNTLEDKIDVIRLCLNAIRNDSLMPVFVFDDTDRWTVGSDDSTIEGFFGEAIRWLAEMDAAVIVATHSRYLDAGLGDPELLTFLDTRVRLPRVPTASDLANILDRRVQFRLNGHDPNERLDAVVDWSAIEELFSAYQERASIRKVMQLAHIALVETVDAGTDKITGREIKAAVQA